MVTADRQLRQKALSLVIYSFTTTPGVTSASGGTLTAVWDRQVRNYVRDCARPYSMGPTWQRPGQDQAFMHSLSGSIHAFV